MRDSIGLHSSKSLNLTWLEKWLDLLTSPQTCWGRGLLRKLQQRLLLVLNISKNGIDSAFNALEEMFTIPNFTAK